MADDEVKPLFFPASPARTKAQFIANIGGELSLWRFGSALRVYVRNYVGYWVVGLRDRLRGTSSEELRKLLRHMDLIEVYAAMLMEKEN